LVVVVVVSHIWNYNAVLIPGMGRKAQSTLDAKSERNTGTQKDNK
jgi:hypothetical protein